VLNVRVFSVVRGLPKPSSVFAPFAPWRLMSLARLGIQKNWLQNWLQTGDKQPQPPFCRDA
jgi:hypothetical protein